jgi:hypothetical protein
MAALAESVATMSLASTSSDAPKFTFTVVACTPASLEEHLPSLLELQAAVYRPEHQETREVFQSFAEHHAAIALDENSVVVGYALAHHVDDANSPPPLNVPLHPQAPPSLTPANSCLFIHDIATSWPGHGVGSALLNHLLRDCCTEASLVAVNGNESYWGKFGFKSTPCDPALLTSYNDPSAALMILPAPRIFSLHPPTRAFVPNPQGGAKNPIRMASASSKAVAPEKLNPLPSNYVTPSTNGFRSLAKTTSFFPPLDPAQSRVVVDIGCSTGETTRILSKHISSEKDFVVGIDRGWQALKQCRSLSKTELEKQIKYTQIDVVEFPHLVVEEIKSFDADECIVFLDIGGDRMADTVVTFTDYLFLHVNPSLVVIKSEEIWKSLAEWREPPDVNDAPEISTGRDIPWRRAKLTIKEMPPPTKWVHAKRGDDQKGTMHPTKAPNRTSPFSGTSICRFWSYGVCKKFEHYGKPGWEKFGVCEFDHETCHVCLAAGHKALNCAEWQKQLRERKNN